tara:strand:+ start:685 stop:873 length:189 start_codon:yes stop_codon:yes gene_type:complete
MKIGDLVRYGNGKDYGLGIIIGVVNHNMAGIALTCTVLWNNGVESNHSSKWLIKIQETSEDT